MKFVISMKYFWRNDVENKKCTFDSLLCSPNTVILDVQCSWLPLLASGWTRNFPRFIDTSVIVFQESFLNCNLLEFRETIVTAVTDSTLNLIATGNIYFRW